jgi:uncharacterized SAM-binding protein YcdF (DUF218 family)
VAGAFLVHQDQASKADAIVVLGADVPIRAMAAADLYKQGMAPTVLLCPGNLSSEWKRAVSELGVDLPDDAEMNRRVLIRLGVPTVAIQRIGEADGTIGEAKEVLSLARRTGIMSILVVTSKYHTRRTGQIFRWVMGDTVSVKVIASSYDSFNPSRWWQNRSDIRSVMFEYQKLLIFAL